MSEANRLIYRNGFLAYTINANINFDPYGWMTRQIDNLVIKTHPDTELVVVEGPLARLVLIGEAYNPIDRVFNSADVARQLNDKLSGADDDFLDCLDHLSGRFAIFTQKGEQWEVYHDAIGSRSVFFHKETSIVSSHAQIIAEVMEARFHDFFIPFITSRNWFHRDVKYLPGALTAYADIDQLTPNQRINLGTRVVERYWPRKELRSRHSQREEDAARLLKDHMNALRDYIKATGRVPLIGLTGGTDSRGLYAALNQISPIIFCWVRSKLGDQISSKDSRVALKLAGTMGQAVDVFPIASPTLNSADNPLGYAFRKSTAYYRGTDSTWLYKIREYNIDYAKGVFVRGFGGEVLRGFYHSTNSNIKDVNPQSLSRAYDLNAGSNFTRHAFEAFICSTNFEKSRFLGRDPNDMFYWEHRMGTWGSIAMSEADIVQRSLVGYNSRVLFDAFFRQNYESRVTRTAFHDFISEACPKLAKIPTV